VNIGEVFVTLGVKGKGLGTLKDVAQMVANLPVDAAAAIAGMAGISLELGKMAEEAMATSIAFQAFSNQTGLSWQELQRWQLVAEQANVSTQTVATSVSTLERNLAEIRLGRGNIAPFQMLGISPNQNAFAVIEQLRQKIKGINPATATNLISQMGLSPEMMNVLRLTDRQFGEFAAHIHGINEKQEKDFLRMKLTITQLGETFRYAMFGIVSDLSEAWQKLSTFKGALQQLGIAAVAVAAYFFPLTAALAAMLIVLDDLAVYSVGGKSLFGVGLKGFDKFMKDLTGQHDFSILDKLQHFADIMERIQKASEHAGAATRRLFDDLFHSGISGTIQALRSGTPPTPEVRNMDSVVNIHVNSAGPLDAPGWGDVAHMVRRSVEDAHLQLNN
jgi:hypothetical protein